MATKDERYPVALHTYAGLSDSTNGTSRSSGVVYRQGGARRVGVANPYWRSQVQRGHNATTPFSGTYVNWKEVKGLSLNWVYKSQTWKPNFDGRGYHYGGGAIVGSLTDFPFPATLSPVARAAQAFYEQCYKAQDKFEGATALVESRHAVSGITSMFDNMKDLLLGNKAGSIGRRVRSPRGALRAAAATWLGVQFGLKPMVNDIAKLAEKLASHASQDVTLRLACIVAENDVQTVASFKGQQLGSSSHISYDLTKTQWSQKSTRVIGAIRSPGKTASPFGFDPTSWVIAGYETIPWSFLVDYIVPLGGFLQALAGARDAVLSWICTTTRQTTDSVLNVQCYPSGVGAARGLRFLGNSNGRLQRQTKQVVRTTSAPVLSLPGVNFKPSLTRLFNSIALLAAGNTHAARHGRGL